MLGVQSCLKLFVDKIINMLSINQLQGWNGIKKLLRCTPEWRSNSESVRDVEDQNERERQMKGNIRKKSTISIDNLAMINDD